MEYLGIPITGLIIGILEGFKKLGLNEKYVPIFSVILGVTSGVLLTTSGDIKEGIVLGLAMGLSAVGLYSGTKNTFEK